VPALAHWNAHWNARSDVQTDRELAEAMGRTLEDKDLGDFFATNNTAGIKAS